ncbi:hypothetical protein [Halobaculum limi]|uniref:hypothetical protein n=1 Tax=Halobaculum limi TaxID=3031916 RepID=UPI00240524AA|nr:hypothetical protein [Halobaculum sp. YSMS11]
MSDSPGSSTASDDPPEEPYLAAAAADRWDVLRYPGDTGPVHRVVPAGAGSSVVRTYQRRARSRRRILLALVPVATIGLPAAGWLVWDTFGIAVGVFVAAVTAAIIVRRHVAEDAEEMADVPEVVDASASAETARSYGLENGDTIADAEAYLAANPGARPDRSPEDALAAARRENDRS